MKRRKEKIKINLNDLTLEKKISWKRIPQVMKEITMGSIPPEQLIKLANKKN